MNQLHSPNGQRPKSPRESHSVFGSHSCEDKGIAEVSTALEVENVNCWIDPRDDQLKPQAGPNQTARTLLRCADKVPSGIHHSQKLDEGRAEERESVNAISKNEITSETSRGSTAKTRQQRGRHNRGKPAFEEISWDSVQSKLLSDLSGPETTWIGPITTKALHARLLCGIRFFDKNDKLIGNVPPCAVKQVCKILTLLDKKGELIEELLQVEKDFARSGLEKLRLATPHPACFSCTQFLCPVKAQTCFEVEPDPEL